MPNATLLARQPVCSCCSRMPIVRRGKLSPILAIALPCRVLFHHHANGWPSSKFSAPSCQPRAGSLFTFPSWEMDESFLISSRWLMVWSPVYGGHSEIHCRDQLSSTHNSRVRVPARDAYSAAGMNGSGIDSGLGNRWHGNITTTSGDKSIEKCPEKHTDPRGRARKQKGERQGQSAAA